MHHVMQYLPGKETIPIAINAFLSSIAAHLVTYEKAATLPLHHVMELIKKRYSKDVSDRLEKTYKFVRSEYNNYIKMLGGTINAGTCAAVQQGHKVYTINDEVPLLHFLTGEQQDKHLNQALFIYRYYKWLNTLTLRLIIQNSVHLQF